MIFNSAIQAQNYAYYTSKDAESNAPFYYITKPSMSFGYLGIKAKKPIFFCLLRTRPLLLFLNLFV